jgi:hypothetical protein
MWPFDQNNQQVYQQYAQAYNTGNYNGFDPNQSFGHVEQFMQGAPYDVQQQVYQQHFAQMPYDQRMLLAQRVPPQYAMDINNPASMAQSFSLMGQQQPGLLRQVFNHPILLGSGVVLAGLIAKHMIDHHERYEQQYGYNQGGYNQGYQNQGYLQQELNQERREDRELRRELRQEEHREERFEEREEHHHHRREDYY